MTDIIAVTYNNDRPTVSGRELHEKLEIKTAYKDWFPRMCEYGFEEGEDFNPLNFEQVRIEGAREVTRNIVDHQLTIEMAKQICMIQRTDAGKRYREYFLDIEKKWNSPEAIMGRALKIAEAKLTEAKNVIAVLEPKASYYDRVADSTGLSSIRETAKVYGIREKDFIKYLIEKNLLYRDARGKLIPYAESRKDKWFETKEVLIQTYAGDSITVSTKITPLGRTKIYEKMKKEGVI